MMEHINKFKAALAAIAAALTALWGWFGWLVFALALCMALDYVTGTLAAMAQGKWASNVARRGLWHKLGIIVAVLAACILDVVMGHIVNNVPGLQLPFSYTVAIAPVVVSWYILTELGSILENSGKLGGKQPAWFKKAIAALKDKVDDAAAQNKK